MKKALLAVAAVAVIIWIVSWFRAPDAVATSAGRPWPGGMGTLDSAHERFPPRQGNDASGKLTLLGNALPKSNAVDEFVRREIARGELTIGEPPVLPAVAQIRELLLREPIVWERRHVEVGDAETSAMRAMLMSVARTLVASALSRARADDPAAWEDLHAVWNLARSLDGEPQMMTRTAALTMSRTINAVAWKMPLPAPAWLGELQARDDVRPLLEAFQYQAASYWEDGARMFPTRWLANSVEHDRRIAEALFQTTRCDVTTPMNELGTDLSSVWRRAFRYRAEREATANALRIREGKPIETKSVCSDGTWTFDGATLRFSHPIPSNTSEKPMPLVLHVRHWNSVTSSRPAVPLNFSAVEDHPRGPRNSDRPAQMRTRAGRL